MKLIFLSLVILSVVYSCQPLESEISTSADIKLIFSTDTILFDTLLTERLSITKRFRIFNTSKHAVSIDNIRLGLGSGSNYRIFANGKEGPAISDEVLNGGDSILVLVDADIDPEDEDMPYLVKDSVIVEWNTNRAHVKLVAWGQDAHYLKQHSLCDETWDSDRPYVIYDSLFIPPDCQLTIDPGVRILFNNNAALHVAGSLVVQGDSGSQVIFRNIRFDKNYIEAPGQWGHPEIGAGIIFYPQSTGNQIDYAIIENANGGIYMGIPDEDEDFDLVINHTIIRHMTRYGILSFTSDIYAANSLFYNCGSALLANLAGGSYSYEHCTFSNYPNFFVTEDPALQFSDYVETGENPIISDLDVEITNSIIWGANKNEIIINEGGANINLDLTSNIIKYDGDIPNNFTSNESNFPGFRDQIAFDYSLDSLSFAIDQAIPGEITLDILGRERDSDPDIGAFEYIEE